MSPMRLLTIVLLALCACGSALAQDERRPNILFLFADDHRPDAIGAAGNPHIQTPHIDGLAERGFRFTRNYCMGSIHGAVCQPSRAMLHAGRTLYRVEMNLSGVPTLGETLRAAGYATFGTGKWHNGGESFLRSFEQGRNVMLGGMSNHLAVPIRHVQPDGELSPRSIGEGFSSELFADAAIEFLDGLDATSDQPFFAYVSFTAPHDPRQPPLSYRKMYYEKRPPLPKNFMPQHPFHNGWMSGRDESLAPWPRTREVVGDQLAEYYGLITHMDDQIGRILEALERSGHADDTIVVFTADHGLAVGSHGLLGKQSVYEHAMGAPLVVAGPGIPQGESEALTYLYDLMPTLLDEAGVEVPSDVEGKSLRPVWEGKSAGVRDSLYLTYENKMRAVTDGRWKLIRYPPIDHEQLFDLESDPDELVDLASEAAHRDRLTALRALMQRHHAALDDPHPLEVERPRSKQVDMTGRKRKADGHQPEWIQEKYFSDQAPPRPNLLFIMVDDLGPEWISACGGNFHTPNIDRIADEGTRFENVYSMPKCTPTRATLLTGQYPFRHGWVNHWDVPRWGVGCHFDPEHNPTWPQALKQVGYRTAIAGKWQLNDFRVQPDVLEAHGFDDWCMWTGGEGGNPQSNERYHTPYVHTKEGSALREGKFGPDLYTDFLIEFMRENAEHPMLLYYPMALTHTPLIATPLDPDAETKEQRHRAMVRYTDHLVGRLLDTIDELDLAHETLVIFTTDNGTARGIDGQLRGRVVRGGKGRMVEAGCRAPFFARWVGQVTPGRTVPALVDFSDVFPTMLELAGAAAPADHPLDGVSFADPLLGFGGKGHREWMMAMGGRTAHQRNGRVVPELPYAPRVLRTVEYKLWIDAAGNPERLHHLPSDPDETANLIDRPEGKAKAALELLTEAARKFPETDGHPRYDALPAQPWDKKPPKSR
ncbi:MAG: sulfatase-like hydrolase/transferase [bacterium]|nr:sulfatase-like hydrolase/transferase [bacterium]